MIFSAGELVVYGGEGVCSVEAVGPSCVPGADKTKLYYTLQPLLRTGRVLTPVDTRVLIRPVISAQEAKKIVEQLPFLQPEQPLPANPRAWKEYYQATVTSYDCWRIAALLRLLIGRRLESLRQGKKPSQMDERYEKRAEEQLYSELAVVLGIPRQEMETYIRQFHPQWPEI